MAKNKYYVVWKGRSPGIYDNWEACKREVFNEKGALFKGFPDLKNAEAAFRMGFEAYQNAAPINKVKACNSSEQPINQAFAVDAACSGNPGKMEYRGVFIGTGAEIFRSPIFENGTNNIGEFLAIVHALAYQKKNGISFPIYSDSVNAQIWIKQKKCKTKLEPNSKNTYLFELIQRAENWLANNAVDIPILKWRTEIWGEIPADFGRK